MNNKIVQRIIERTGQKDLMDILTKKISFSELSSLLLEVYKIKVGEITPSGLLKSYEANRFVKPCEAMPIELLQLELDILRIAQSFSFTPIELSPVSTLGTCSVIATADQNKIISALRGTEVLADATNSLALHICNLKMNMKDKGAGCGRMKFCAVHRHVRAQKYDHPGSLPHFKLFCMVTSGTDKGSYIFEKESILEHINVYKAVFNQMVDTANFKIRFMEVGGYPDFEGFNARLMEYLHENLDERICTLENTVKLDNQYYKGLQFKIYVNINGEDFEVADGGFVDWSQKLLQSKKERLLISGLGLERLSSIIRNDHE